MPTPSFTGSIAPSATRRYINYSEANFEVFRPAGATHCIDWGKVWHGGGDPDPRQISPQSVQRLGIGAPILKLLLIFDQNVEHKRHSGAYSLRDFHRISVCVSC